MIPVLRLFFALQFSYSLETSAHGLTNSLADEESVLSTALSLRGLALEKKTGIKFDVIPKARLERLTFSRGQSAAGQYDVETGDVLFSVVIWSDLNVRLKKPLRLASGFEVAADDGFQRIADHELGHALADQVSHRHGNGPWFLPEHMMRLRQSDALGLSVVSEGVGTWFEKVQHPSDTIYSEELFPDREEDIYLYSSLDGIIYDGGYWVVSEILDRHHERGLIWLITHPLSLGPYSMRADAVEYRKRALSQLDNTASPK